MKIKVIIVALAVATVALLIALFATKKQSQEQHEADVNSLMDFSNQLMNAQVRITDLSQVNLTLTNDIATDMNQLTVLSNSLESATTALTESQTSLANAQQQVTNLNLHITDLETQNKVLDQRAVELNSLIAQLNQSIAETQSKLASSQSNNAYLQLELQKQMAAKAEIEHKFNDLGELRAQVSKVKTDLFVARRMQLMRNDTGGKKGAELLMAPSHPSSAAPNGANYGLNVEVSSDGSVKVIPPITATNAPSK